MAKSRLINCGFVNAGSFKLNVSNKAKLLYYSMFVAADDKGFVDTTNDIINALKQNDIDFDKNVSLELVETTYDTALTELIERGYLYEFRDKHKNKVHLIRHWFLHNKWKAHLWTSYFNFLELVEIKNGEYVMKPFKEDKLNINQDKPNQDKLSNEPNETEQPSEESTEEDMSWLLD